MEIPSLAETETSPTPDEATFSLYMKHLERKSKCTGLLPLSRLALSCLVLTCCLLGGSRKQTHHSKCTCAYAFRLFGADQGSLEGSFICQFMPVQKLHFLRELFHLRLVLA